MQVPITINFRARSQDFLRGGGGGDQKKSGPQLSGGGGGGARGAPRTPFFNKKVDLSCLWGGASAPLAPPLATGLNSEL